MQSLILFCVFALSSSMSGAIIVDNYSTAPSNNQLISISKNYNDLLSNLDQQSLNGIKNQLTWQNSAFNSQESGIHLPQTGLENTVQISADNSFEDAENEQKLSYDSKFGLKNLVENLDLSSPHIVKIPVPQPYPVHIPVKQPFTVPIYKLVAKEVEKKYPILVEKLVPVYKKKPVKIVVEKHFPVHVLKPYAVPVPVNTHILIGRKKPEKLW